MKSSRSTCILVVLSEVLIQRYILGSSATDLPPACQCRYKQWVHVLQQDSEARGKTLAKYALGLFPTKLASATLNFNISNSPLLPQAYLTNLGH